MKRIRARIADWVWEYGDAARYAVVMLGSVLGSAAVVLVERLVMGEGGGEVQ